MKNRKAAVKNRKAAVKRNREDTVGRKETDALALCPLFAGMGGKAAAEIAGRFGLRETADKGETVSLSPAGTPRVGVVLSGCLAVYAGNTLLNRIRPGGLFGVATLYGRGQGAPTRIAAEEASLLLFFTQEEIEDLTEDLTIRRNLLAFLSDRIRFLNRKVATFSAPSAQRKLVLYLLERERSGEVLPDRSLTELAGVLDLGRASLYRALKELEDKGLIRRKGRTVLIPDRKALEEVR